MTRTLKQEVRGDLAKVLGANVAAFTTLIVTRVLAVPGVGRNLAGSGESIGASAAAMIICAILADQFGPLTKARLVFWRWKDPLPGCRAFSEIGPNDPRVDMGRIGRLLPEVPTEPRKQNECWYQLYEKVKQEVRVMDAQKGYLFARDYSCLSLLFVLGLGPIAFWRLGATPWSLLYGVLLLGQYLVVRNAAANRGARFVATVLAVQSGPTEKARKAATKKKESTQ